MRPPRRALLRENRELVIEQGRGWAAGSYYLHDIIDEIDEAHYQSELKQFKKYSPDKDPDPEEEEYWRHETKHSIS